MNKRQKRKQHNYNKYGLRKMSIIECLNKSQFVKDYGLSGGRICLDLFRYMRSFRDNIDDVIGFGFWSRRKFYLWTDFMVYQIWFNRGTYIINNMPREVLPGTYAMYDQSEGL